MHYKLLQQNRSVLLLSGAAVVFLMALDKFAAFFRFRRNVGKMRRRQEERNQHLRSVGEC